MKPIIACTLGALWILTFLQVQAQSIIAGQASGATILYHDIQDVEVSSTYWWDEEYKYLDLNEDGVIDLALLTNWIYFSHTNFQSVTAGCNPAGGFEYSSLSDNPTWIKKHSAGEVINDSLNFIADNGLFFKQFSSKSDEGNFNGEGYLGFRICNPDTLYGWLRIKCNVSFSGAYLTAYEYAYVINNTGLLDEMDITIEKNIHKSGNSLMLKIPAQQFPHACHLDAFDVTGKQVFHYELMPGSHSLNISGYPRGLYILRISNIHGRSFSGKIIF